MLVRNLVLLLFFAIATVLSATCSDDGLSSLASIRLRNDVIPCDYDKTIHPAKNHNKFTNVTFKIVLRSFNYDHHSSTITIDSWVGAEWFDEHLKWNPKDYEGIDNLFISSDELWIPNISIYNRAVQSGDAQILTTTPCFVSDQGFVRCVPPTRMDALCVADLTKFPFDTQNCTLEFGSWLHPGEEFDITLSNVDRDHFKPNGEWEIIDINRLKKVHTHDWLPNETYPNIYVDFIIKRLSGSHTASLVIPALVAVALTLTSLWLSPASKDRFILCILNLLAHFFNLQYVSSKVPMNGDKIPLLMLFARDSLLLCSFTIVFTVMLKNIVEKKSLPPRCVSSVVSFVVNCGLGQFAFLNDYSTKGKAFFNGEEDGTTIINSSESNSNVQDWAVFAKILDRLCFIVYVIIYFVMIIEFTP